MGQHRDWNSDKRRDLARSTCSPLKKIAHASRKVKRNANRRLRRAQNMAIVAVLKNACLCNENPDYCPRCDQETSAFSSTNEISARRESAQRKICENLSPSHRHS